jgi:hypothetical protein
MTEFEERYENAEQFRDVDKLLGEKQPITPNEAMEYFRENLRLHSGDWRPVDNVIRQSLASIRDLYLQVMAEQWDAKHTPTQSSESFWLHWEKIRLNILIRVQNILSHEASERIEKEGENRYPKGAAAKPNAVFDAVSSFIKKFAFWKKR